MPTEDLSQNDITRIDSILRRGRPKNALPKTAHEASDQLKSSAQAGSDLSNMLAQWRITHPRQAIPPFLEAAITLQNRRTQELEGLVTELNRTAALTAPSDALSPGEHADAVKLGMTDAQYAHRIIANDAAMGQPARFTFGSNGAVTGQRSPSRKHVPINGGRGAVGPSKLDMAAALTVGTAEGIGEGTGNVVQAAAAGTEGFVSNVADATHLVAAGAHYGYDAATGNAADERKQEDRARTIFERQKQQFAAQYGAEEGGWLYRLVQAAGEAAGGQTGDAIDILKHIPAEELKGFDPSNPDFDKNLAGLGVGLATYAINHRAETLEGAAGKLEVRAAQIDRAEGAGSATAAQLRSRATLYRRLADVRTIPVVKKTVDTLSTFVQTKPRLVKALALARRGAAVYNRFVVGAKTPASKVDKDRLVASKGAEKAAETDHLPVSTSNLSASTDDPSHPDGNIDAEKAEETKQSAENGQDGMIDSPLSPLADSPLIVKGTGQGDKTLVDDVTKALNDSTKQALGSLDLNSPAEKRIQRAVQLGLQDLKALQDQKGDLGDDWYTDEIERMKHAVIQMDPSLADPANMTFFMTLLSVLSGQSSVSTNFNVALNVYKLSIESLRDGKNKVTIPLMNDTDPGRIRKWSGRNAKRHLRKVQGLLDAHGGIEGMAKWLTKKHPKKELHEFNANVEIDDNDDEYGFAVLGPKMGNFAANLHGFSGLATLDLWMTRQWNRWMGTSFSESGVARKQPRTPAERAAMTAALEILAVLTGSTVSATQARLWYYEKLLYAKHGISVGGDSYGSIAEKIGRERLGDEFKFYGETASRYRPNAADIGAEGSARQVSSDLSGGVGQSTSDGSREDEAREKSETVILSPVQDHASEPLPGLVDDSNPMAAVADTQPDKSVSSPDAATASAQGAAQPAIFDSAPDPPDDMSPADTDPADIGGAFSLPPDEPADPRPGGDALATGSRAAPSGSEQRSPSDVIDQLTALAARLDNGIPLESALADLSGRQSQSPQNALAPQRPDAPIGTETSAKTSSALDKFRREP